MSAPYVYPPNVNTTVTRAALDALAEHVARREQEAAARALRDAAREARTRGDIGKDGGPDVWTWLGHLAEGVAP